MEYFVPAWHSQLKDWSVSIPMIENYDATRTMEVLKDNNHQIGLIVTDYQPQLLSKLNRLSFTPEKIFSIYDYLQGIKTFAGKIVELTDFNWPKNAIFDFGPFRTLVVVDDKLFATVFYDIDGHILKVEYKGTSEAENYTLLMDSRGFISSKITQKEVIYYNPYEEWRFKQKRNDGRILINPNFKFCEKVTYSNINELISEVLTNYLITTFNSVRDHLIVTLDDKATVSTGIFADKNPIYILNKSIPYQTTLAEIPQGNLVVNDQFEADEINQKYGNKFNITIIPTHNAEFKLGHSARQTRQEITFFAENIDGQEAKKFILNICNYVAASQKDRSLKIFTYDINQFNRINTVVEEIKQENRENFTIGDEAKQAENASLEEKEDSKKIPNIKVDHQRLTSISQLLNLLDTTRVLINYGKVDELIQMAAISIGIPQLQNFLSSTVVNGKNGFIYKDIDELINYIDYYLNDLNAWNNALVYNVQLMNQYSETNIMKKWKALLNNSQED
ncbi:accessory Sec system protein Asp1 [Lactobacillus agrestimuris]|uniref:accessory Sec system protein Asp1 n=1 Tax=Lactobacillus agrestimuris TaxID=2941328 RepID=UPI00204393CC|nr:accessory Sec system protein Asp1 [Lactobacillus agrestimuris]